MRDDTLLKLLLDQPIAGDSSQILVRSKLRAVGRRMGFSDLKRERMELVATEILTNQYKYACGSGLIQLWEWNGPMPALDLFALDYGPGIDDLELARSDGFTTSGTLGKGIGAIHRLADESALYSRPTESAAGGWHGVAVWVRFHLREPEPLPYQIGLFLRAYQDAIHNGDCICVDFDAEQLRWLHMDGLGHGLEAAKAVADMGTVLERERTPIGVMARASETLRGTRGAVGIFGELDTASRQARVCGVGDMTAALLSSEGRRNIQFSPGVLGHSHRSCETTEHELGRETLLLTASDGLRRNWEPVGFPGLFQLHPQMVAYLLGNVAGRSNDDKSIFLVRLGTGQRIMSGEVGQ
ncbi:SpoIIE family protein phosphatase [Endothiovibrio diazotrophicus]